jgi:hypothetical protein
VDWRVLLNTDVFLLRSLSIKTDESNVAKLAKLLVNEWEDALVEEVLEVAQEWTDTNVTGSEQLVFVIALRQSLAVCTT